MARRPTPVSSCEAESKLFRPIGVFGVVGRVPRSCERRSVGRKSKMRKKALDRLALGDHREHSESAVALRTLQRVDTKRSSQQARPIDSRGGSVQHTSEDPIPVTYREHILGEGNNVAAARHGIEYDRYSVRVSV